MIIVNIYDEEFECTKAVKGSNFVHLYDEQNNCLLSCEGISSFDGYSISGGDWSEPEPTENEMLRADLDYCLMILEG